MLKAILVDDEPIVRRALRQLTDWEEAGIEIAGEAFNGQEAVNLLAEKDIDIIITDMKMPDMNGLELIAHVRARNKDIKIIAISAYDDFYMVGDAYKLGVEDYILKSDLNLGKLAAVLKNVKSRIHADRNEKDKEQAAKTKLARQLEEYQQAQACIALNRLPIKERLLKDIVTANGNPLAGVISQCQQMGLHVHNGLNLISILTVEPTMRLEDGDCPGLSEAQQCCVRDALESALAEKNLGEAYQDNAYGYVVLFSFDKTLSANRIKKQLDAFHDDLTQRIYHRSGLKVSAGISQIARNLDHGAEMLKQAQQALKCIFIYGKGRKIAYDRSFGIGNGLKINTTERMNTLKGILEAGDVPGWQQRLEALCFRGSELDVSCIDEVKDVYRGYYVHIMEYAKANHIYQEIQPLMECYESRLSLTGDLDELNQWIPGVLNKLIALKNSGNSTINKARAYINQHYHQSLSLTDVADYLGLNPSYLSRLFSQYTGYSFSQYLTNVRMDYAIRYLKETSLNISEIAEKVGYSNQENFSRSFKKATGKSPKRY